MAEDLLDVAMDLVIDTAGHILASIGVGPNNQESHPWSKHTIIIPLTWRITVDNIPMDWIPIVMSITRKVQHKVRTFLAYV